MKGAQSCILFLCLFLQLLRESEANSMRLTEQAKVLKDEIRRYRTIARPCLGEKFIAVCTFV